MGLGRGAGAVGKGEGPPVILIKVLMKKFLEFLDSTYCFWDYFQCVAYTI